MILVRPIKKPTNRRTQMAASAIYMAVSFFQLESVEVDAPVIDESSKLPDNLPSSIWSLA